MHVKAKRVATAGLLVALSVVFLILSSIIESSSLFFIVAAAFCVGIAIREWGRLWGLGFLIASEALGFLLAPNKIYCITFAAVSIYILLYECLWRWLADSENVRNRNVWLWVGRYLIFNLLYVPTLLLAPGLLFVGKVNGIFIFVMLLLGQVALPVFDLAYRYFQSHIWGKMRVKLME